MGDTLYSINEEIKSLVDQMFLAVDEETGEIPEEYVEKLGELQVKKNDKLEALGVIYKSKLAFKKALQDEKKNLDKGIKSCDRELEWIKNYVSSILGGEKWEESAKVQYSWRKSEQTVVDDETLIPEEYFKVKTEKSADLTAIKKAIKDGIITQGAHIDVNNNLQVK